MKNCFSMTFNGLEFLFPKRTISFTHGFGIVKGLYEDVIEDECYIKEPLIGVVDQNFKPVISLFPERMLGKIEFLNDKVIFIQLKESLKEEGYQVYQINYLNGEPDVLVLPGLDFFPISSNIVKIKSKSESGMGMLESLYDVSKAKFVSDQFHFIDSFHYDEERKEMVAEVTYFLPYDENRANQIITHINLKGEVISSYFDVDQDKYYASDLDLEDIFSSIMDDMKTKMSR